MRLLTRVYGIYSKTVRLPRDWLVQVLLVVKVSDGTMIAKTETVGLKAYLLQLEGHMQCRRVKLPTCFFFEYHISAIGPCNYYLFTARFCVGTI